jgi:hypothetical protein
VRFHCSKCEDFDLCSQCQYDGASDKHDLEHSFYQIHYRRLSLPPANGEDFELLHSFERGTTSRSFYLHFPWFFGPPVFEQLISGAPNEGECRDLLTQLEGSLDGIQLQVALDGVIRLLAPEDWNWRQVQDHIRPVLDLQLVRAEYSGLFHSLYLALKTQINLTQNTRHAESTEVLALRKQLFRASLDSTSAARCMDSMNAFLDARLNSTGIAEVPVSTENISESARYIEMLSKGFDVRV